MARFSLIARAWPLALVALLALLALARPIDHDESQYVAATVLAWHGLPYRDFAYLQTPLQPLLLAPLAALAGTLAWPALRLANTAFALLAVGAVYRAARIAGAGAGPARIGALLFAGTDILLFGAAVARNDTLPAMLLAVALIPIVQAAKGEGSARGAMLAGLCLSAATAAKVSYAIPALALGLYALVDRRQRPVALAIGALPPALLVLVLWRLAPAAFVYDVITFPALAPADYYRAVDNRWKLTLAAKAIDTVKFLALGAALPAIVLLVRRKGGDPRWRVLDLLIVAGLIAGIAPQPTWRQYLLPMLPPLFVRLGIALKARPLGRAERVAMIVFACAGLSLSTEALILSARHGLTMAVADRDGRQLGVALRRAAVAGPVATLAPQYLAAARYPPDPRFAAGPYQFRTRGLIGAEDERHFHTVSLATLDALLTEPGDRPAAIVIGGEDATTAGDPNTDAALENWAVRNRWRRAPGTPRFRLYLPPALSSRP